LRRRGQRFPQALGASPPWQDADAAGQQQWRALTREAALRGKRVAGLPAAAYGGHKDVNEAWVAGVLRLAAWTATVGEGPAGWESPQDLQERWEERTAIMVYDGKLPPAEAARRAWAGG